MLAGNVQDDAARHEERQARRLGEEIDERRSRVSQMLEVVQEKEQLPPAQCRDERRERLASDLLDAERAEDLADDELRIVDGASSTNAAPFAKEPAL